MPGTARNPQDLQRRLGRTVRELRAEARLTQEQVADASGLHRNYVGGIERGERNPSFVQLVRLAHGLGTSLGDLFSRFEQLEG